VAPVPARLRDYSLFTQRSVEVTKIRRSLRICIGIAGSAGPDPFSRTLRVVSSLAAAPAAVGARALEVPTTAAAIVGGPRASDVGLGSEHRKLRQDCRLCVAAAQCGKQLVPLLAPTNVAARLMSL
jgi:hypothetical protein